MTRKTIVWIVIGVLAAALVAAVGVVSYHVGFNHGGVRGVVRIGAQRPMRNFVFGNGVVRREVGFPGLGVFAALLLAGGIGAAIVYLVNPGRRPAGAFAGGPGAVAGSAAAGSVAGSAAAPGAAPGAGGPYDPQWQQYEQWRQFEQWHRQMHGAGPGAPPAATPAPGVPEGGSTTMTQAQAAAPPNAPVATSPETPASPEAPASPEGPASPEAPASPGTPVSPQAERPSGSEPDGVA